MLAARIRALGLALLVVVCIGLTGCGPGDRKFISTDVKHPDGSDVFAVDAIDPEFGRPDVQIICRHGNETAAAASTSSSGSAGPEPPESRPRLRDPADPGDQPGSTGSPPGRPRLR